MQNTINLTDLYHNQAHEYRVALEREVQHTYRIFGQPLRDDVRRVLLQSLKEISIPTIDTSKYDAGEVMRTPKPNWLLIRRQVMESI
jgi:pantothenate kinase-related protein Tda10